MKPSYRPPRTGGLACLLAALLAAPGACPPVQAAPQAARILLKLKGVKQGPIRGDAALRGFEKAITLTAFSHATVSPRDPASGLPTGQVRSRGILVTKPIDAASIKLWQALVTNEMLTEATVTFFRAGTTGGETPYLTIRLTNGSVASIEQRMQSAESRLASSGTPELAHEEVLFMFDQEQQEETSGPGATMRRQPLRP